LVVEEDQAEGEEIAVAKAVPEEGRQTVVGPVGVSGDLYLIWSIEKLLRMCVW
jgi:hypothetical protein